MAGYPKPFEFDFEVQAEFERLRDHKADPERGVRTAIRTPSFWLPGTSPT